MVAMVDRFVCVDRNRRQIAYMHKEIHVESPN